MAAPPDRPDTGVVPDRFLGTVYLLHFDRPYRHARHYIGWAQDLQARLMAHATGQGARLLQVVRAAGIGWSLARTWPGTRNRERQLKRMGGAGRRCPLCGVHPRPDEPERVRPEWAEAYRLRALIDQWWVCTDPTERARIDAEIDAVTAIPPNPAVPSITGLIKPHTVGVAA